MYEGAEVETDINVLDRDIWPRTSLCEHDVPAEDVLVEDVPAEDVPAEDLSSTWTSPSRRPDRDVLGGDIMSAQGHP